MGVLAEYDGLPSMSQMEGVTYKQPIPGKDTNHGCGHNLFAGGSIGAALAVKDYIETTGNGRITLFGCPGEEGGGGKVFMAREGVFQRCGCCGQLAPGADVHGAHPACSGKCEDQLQL